MIQYGLPDRLLLDRIENLVFAGAPPTWLSHKCLAPAPQPPRQQLYTALSETWNTTATSSRSLPATNAATARIRNASCADSDNCRASPTSSLTQRSTTQNTYRFGSIADSETAVAEQPGDRPLDLPAVSAEPLAGLDARARDARDESS